MFDIETNKLLLLDNMIVYFMICPFKINVF